MIKHFLEFSKKIFDENKLLNYRKFYNVIDQSWFKYILDNSLDRQQLERYLQSNIRSVFQDYQNYDFEIVYRFNDNNNYNLKWHIDNCIFQRHSVKTIELLHDLEIIARDNKYLYCIWKYKKIPKYTMIIYISNYLIDFKGGELEFIDGLLIKPKKGDIIIFDSREIHRVHPLKSGIRNCIVIKFY
jgi:hypothetical protein